MKKLKFLGKISLLSMILFLTASCGKETMQTTENSSEAYYAERSINSEGDEYKKVKDQDDASLKKGSMSIAAIAIANDFNELVAALSYVDSAEGTALVDLFLNGTDQYTVFAPTDAAFYNLYDALGVDEITDISSSLVLDVLLYHVTEGRRASNSVVPKKNPKNIESLLGESFSVNSDLSIDAIGNTANIIAADISASNGIIHVIDAVILPIN